MTLKDIEREAAALGAADLPVTVNGAEPSVSILHGADGDTLELEEVGA